MSSPLKGLPSPSGLPMPQMFPEPLANRYTYCQVLDVPDQLGQASTKSRQHRQSRSLAFYSWTEVGLGAWAAPAACRLPFFSLHTMPCSGHPATAGKPDLLCPPDPSQQLLPPPVSWCGFIYSPRLSTWAHLSVIA